ncbi:MAG: SDR family NAD(P)-dependent oxidoreductase [Chitinophagaceae bacterium]
MRDLATKVAVITGAANGLGRALALCLYKQHFNLALLDIDIDGLTKLQRELSNNTQAISIHQVDVSNEEQIIAARKEILQRHQHVDILINNAGVSISQPFDQLALDDYKWLFDINFWGTVYCCKHFLPDLQEQPGSRLVNIISDFALMGFPGKTSYASSKAAVMGFSNALYTELNGTNVKLSIVIPPALDTNIVKNGKHIDEIKRTKEAEFLQKNGMSLDKAATRIISKVKAGKYRVVIGSMMFWTDLGSRLFPTWIHKLIWKNKKKFRFV